MFRKKRRTPPKEMTLNISSLMDILTILLLFLILSFDSQEQNISPPEGFELPDSSSELAVKIAVKVTISPDQVFVEDKVVVKLAGGDFRKTDLDSSKRITPLLKELQRQKARLQAGSSTAVEDQEDEKEIVFLEAAKGTHFKIVDRVLKSAAAAGFTKFRLAVNRRS